MPKQRNLCPPKNSPDKDLIYTPDDLAQQIVDHFKPFGKCLEPCYGDARAFIKALYPYASTLDGCELSHGTDFFEWPEKNYDWIVTNFPFSKYADFLQKSMTIADNVLTYGTVCHILALKKRLRLIKEAGFYVREILFTNTPKGWSTGGFQTGAILLTKVAGDCKISHL